MQALEYPDKSTKKDSKATAAAAESDEDDDEDIDVFKLMEEED